MRVDMHTMPMEAEEHPQKSQRNCCEQLEPTPGSSTRRTVSAPNAEPLVQPHHFEILRSYIKKCGGSEHRVGRHMLRTRCTHILLPRPPVRLMLASLS